MDKLFQMRIDKLKHDVLESIERNSGGILKYVMLIIVFVFAGRLLYEKSEVLGVLCSRIRSMLDVANPGIYGVCDNLYVGSLAIKILK